MTAHDDPPAFFVPDGDRFLPTDRARGPWNPESLSGWVMMGLLAHATESHLPEGFHVARLTVDMFRPPPFAPASVRTEIVRSGSRIRIVDAVLTVEGQDVARSTATMVRFGDLPDGSIWEPPPSSIPAPESVTPVEGTNARARSWDIRHVGAPMGQAGRRVAWLRQTAPLIEGTDTSAFVRLATQSDYTNPFANSGDRGLVYINADVTLYLHRPVEGEWLGLEVTSHRAEQGIALGLCRVYDRRGEAGYTAASAISNRLGGR